MPTRSQTRHKQGKLSIIKTEVLLSDEEAVQDIVAEGTAQPTSYKQAKKQTRAKRGRKSTPSAAAIKSEPGLI